MILTSIKMYFLNTFKSLLPQVPFYQQLILSFILSFTIGQYKISIFHHYHSGMSVKVLFFPSGRCHSYYFWIFFTTPFSQYQIPYLKYMNHGRTHDTDLTSLIPNQNTVSRKVTIPTWVKVLPFFFVCDMVGKTFLLLELQ